MMLLLSLPNELLLKIARYLICCPNFHCHHISPELSAISRVNHRLHALLAESALGTSSSCQLLLWAIVNSRNDTLALALERGANPNAPLCRPLNDRTSSGSASTPTELAIRMRANSDDAESHALKLETLVLLFGAGGTCNTFQLIMPISYGDLDLLTLCLPQLVNTPLMRRRAWMRMMLNSAARRGHVEASKLVIAAGAAVNSDGDHTSSEFHPPLWTCWDAPIEVMQVLLDAGADPAWRASIGTSVVQNMRQGAVAGPGLEEKIALLVRYGAIDERPTSVTFTPVTRHGCALPPNPPSAQRREPRRKSPDREYHGWVPGSKAAVVDWPMELVLSRREECACFGCKVGK